jgi:hypothetical protein
MINMRSGLTRCGQGMMEPLQTRNSSSFLPSCKAVSAVTSQGQRAPWPAGPATMPLLLAPLRAVPGVVAPLSSLCHGMFETMIVLLVRSHGCPRVFFAQSCCIIISVARVAVTVFPCVVHADDNGTADGGPPPLSDWPDSSRPCMGFLWWQTLAVVRACLLSSLWHRTCSDVSACSLKPLSNCCRGRASIQRCLLSQTIVHKKLVATVQCVEFSNRVEWKCCWCGE